MIASVQVGGELEIQFPLKDGEDPPDEPEPEPDEEGREPDDPEWVPPQKPVLEVRRCCRTGSSAEPFVDYRS